MKKKTKNIILIVVITIAALGLIAWILSGNKRKNEEKTETVAQRNPTVAVRVDTVRMQPLQLSFLANGKFSPTQQINFSSEVSGRVVSVLVDEGDLVHKGQKLAVIKTGNLNVDLQNAVEAYETSKRSLARYQNALRTGGVTKQQVDEAELEVANARAKVEQAQIKISDANIRSSINGVVNQRFIEPGAVLSPGTELFEIVDISALTLDLSVSESQVAGLTPGYKVGVTAGVLPGKQFEGVVDFVAPKADPNLNFPVKIMVLNNTGNLLKAGMYGTANFKSADSSMRIIISRNAFVGGVNSNQVFIVDAAMTARLRKVVSGRIMGDRVEIVSGLQEGDRLITSGQINLVDGSKINEIRELAATADSTQRSGSADSGRSEPSGADGIPGDATPAKSTKNNQP